MPQQEPIVDLVSKLTPLDSRQIQVSFASSSFVFLDLSHPKAKAWKWILNSMLKHQIPAYVEYDPDSRKITKLRTPLATRVGELKDIDDGLEVDLLESHAVHYLRNDHEQFEKIRTILEKAQREGTRLLVTERINKNEIIDVREDRFFDDKPCKPPSRTLLQTDRSRHTELRVTQDRAEELFIQLADTSCSVCEPEAPCIPFLYPDDGCFARAHEMCRILHEELESPTKLWVYKVGPKLNPCTANYPDCSELWKWHCAPMLDVSESESVSNKLVFDPSLFDQPVSQIDWETAFRVPVTTVETGPDVYIRFNAGTEQHDATFFKTNLFLHRCRAHDALCAITMM